MARLPYGMFDAGRSPEEARRFERAESIYHRGQELAWSGRRVLAELSEKHGGPRLAPEKRESVRVVFGAILWGELAAWKISARLADRLVPLEAKLAATSQAHDEARHFYVMRDYLLRATGSLPRGLGRASEHLLGAVLDARSVAEQLLGMQLQVETSALTLFQLTREARVCPVLTELLPYFEKDEARHVGLGTQVLPVLLRGMGRVEAARFSAFAVRVSLHLLAANHAMDPALRALGIDPRRALRLARAKQLLVWEELWRSTGRHVGIGDAVQRALEAGANGLWPPPGEEDLGGRARAFVRGLRHGVEPIETSLAPEGS